MISEEQQKVSYLKDFLQSLQKSTIEGSAITFCLLPNKNISQYTTFISSQVNQASSIKDKGNRISVIQGLKSIKQKLRQYKQIPENGLISISANVLYPNAYKYQKIVEVIQPPKTITKQVYSCGKVFNFDYIYDQILVNNQTFGFIVIDGSSVLYATLQGAKKQILKEIKSDIMRNHNKGGQSALRFARNRQQSRFQFIKAASQEANKVFLGLNQIISGYIIAGSADIKNQFFQHDVLSSQIKNNTIKLVDISQSSQQGLKQAIYQSKDILLNAKILKEKQILSNFFEKMNIDSKKVTNGFKSVIELIQIGLVQKVICSESLQKQQKEYLKQLCEQNGCTIVLVSNACELSSIFQKSYGGVGGILRYQFDSSYLKQSEEQTGILGNNQFFI